MERGGGRKRTFLQSSPNWTGSGASDATRGPLLTYSPERFGSSMLPGPGWPQWVRAEPWANLSHSLLKGTSAQPKPPARLWRGVGLRMEK